MYPVTRLQLFSLCEAGPSVPLSLGGLFGDKGSRNGTEVACETFPFLIFVS